MGLILKKINDLSTFHIRNIDYSLCGIVCRKLVFESLERIVAVNIGGKHITRGNICKAHARTILTEVDGCKEVVLSLS